MLCKVLVSFRKAPDILPTVIIFHCSEGLEIEREQAG